MWDDTLMMAVLPLAKIDKLLGRKAYVEEATYQFLLHVQNLMDRESGLWFRGGSYDGCHNFANARWARGNRWLIIVIPDFLELRDLPETSAVRRYQLQVLNRQVEALAKCQHETGLWHTLLDDPILTWKPRRRPVLPTAFSRRCESATSAQTMRQSEKRGCGVLWLISRRKGSCCKRRLAPACAVILSFTARYR